MAATSTMLPLGTEAPSFELVDVRTDATVASSDLTAGPLMIVFLSNHCPYVKHLQSGLVALSEDYEDQPIDIVGIAPNDPAVNAEDSPAELARVADDLGYRFPVLFDDSQEIARAYRAACTPDFFLFDGDRRLVYRGQFDDARPRNDEPVTGRDLRGAIDAVLNGRPVPEDQRPSIGCSIKWKAGMEPVDIAG